MPNRLADAVSPYLRSHASNPVDWQQWGDEAFAEAERRNVPVLVSIGYSTCHWCHVMARESFSDPALAGYLNENFVSIKVDREEYPDVDASYLAAASAFTENLGWPLNVFTTPTGKPFYAGTYWPPRAVGGHPAFRDVLAAVLDAWVERRGEVEGNAAQIAAALATTAGREPGPLPGEAEFERVVAELGEFEDGVYGGFGGAPKFPVATVIGFLLDRGSLGDAAAQALAGRALDAMAASGLRDPVEGGFFRYATRRDWSEPHYERMLYDNALLLTAYARAGRGGVAAGVAGFLIDVMQQPGGGFASAQDSESTVDGVRVEGGYYALDAAARAAQTPPALDAKVLAGWNGLAIGALSRAGLLLGRADWIAAAERAADFVLGSHLLRERLVRASIDGRLSPARATLEDYGLFASGLLQLALASGRPRYAGAARSLVDVCLAAGAPFAVPGGADPVLASHGLAIATDPSEGAYPSGPSAMAAASHTLHLLTGESRYRDAARAAMEPFAPLAVQRPIAFGAALAVMSALAAEPVQLVVVSDDADSPVASVARSWQRAGAVSVVVTSEAARGFAASGFELFEGRIVVHGQATAYFCRDFVCALPVSDGTALEKTLPAGALP